MLDFKSVSQDILSSIVCFHVCDNFKREDMMGNALESVYVIKRHANPDKYAVVLSFGFSFSDSSTVMDKNGNFVLEPLPSNRSEKWLERTRFDSIEDAVKTFEKFHRH